jgi:hypothetical protein
MVAEPSARGEKLFYTPKQGESLFRFAQLLRGILRSVFRRFKGEAPIIAEGSHDLQFQILRRRLLYSSSVAAVRRTVAQQVSNWQAT